MNAAMLAQAAMAKRKKMYKSGADDYVVEASGTLKAGEKPKKKEHHKQHMQVTGPPYGRKNHARPAPSHISTSRKGTIKYGGAFPPLDSNNRPDLSFLLPDIVRKAEERSIRLLRTGNKAWKEYTAPNGMKYYHNTITKETTYTVPDMFKKSTKKSTKKEEIKEEWKEYTDPRTGKHYYSNGKKTQWEKPSGFRG